MSDPAPIRVATPRLPVAWGEVIDKLTILDIKCERLTDPTALSNVRHERAILAEAAREQLRGSSALREARDQLFEVNVALWEVEDALREKESARAFDDAFIALARSVYQQNDRRAALKKHINILLGSEIVEEKSYKG